MKDPVRLINRSGLASTLLRAGSEERPSSGQVRRAAAALGTAAAVGAVTGEAVSGGASVVASAKAGAALAKAGGGSVSVLLAAKWAGIGSVGAMLFLGATELGSRATLGATTPPAQVASRSNATRSTAPRAFVLEPAHVDKDEPRGGVAQLSAPPTGEMGAPSPVEGAAISPKRAGERHVREATEQPAAPTLPPSREGSTPSAFDDLPAIAPLAAAPPSGPARPHNDVPSSEEAVGAALEGAGVPRKSEAPAEGTLRLGKEVLLVDSAWSDVKRSQFARALAALSDYERQFPELGLHPEVLFVRMEAENRSGRAAAAKLEASRILALYPRSAQADRARALLDRH